MTQTTADSVQDICIQKNNQAQGGVHVQRTDPPSDPSAPPAPKPRPARVEAAKPQPSPSPPVCTTAPMTAAVQATWISLSSGPNAQAAIANWWAQARSAVLTPSLLSVARATLVQQVPANPPAPSLPPSPNAIGSWRICPGVVSVRWTVPYSPPTATARPEVVYAETVRDTLTLPPITIGAAPPASAGITQFPSEFRVAGYDGKPITTTQSDGRFSVQLISTPVAYLWAFGDGTPASVAAGSAGAVTHVFAQTSARNPQAVGGKYPVTVTIVFDTQFQATGPGTTPGWQDFSSYGLAPLMESATLPYEVDQLYGVLVPSVPGT